MYDPINIVTLIKRCWIWLLVTSYLIQPISCTLSLVFYFHSCCIFYAGTADEGHKFLSNNKKCVLLASFAHYTTFSTLHSHLFIIVLFLFLSPSFSRTPFYGIPVLYSIFFFLFLFTHSECVYFYCYYSHVCILMLEKLKNRFLLYVWFSTYRMNIEPFHCFSYVGYEF